MRDACDVTRTLSAETEKLCKVTWGFLKSRISAECSFRRKISGLKWMFQRVLYVVTSSWTSLPIWRAINWKSGPAAWHPRVWIETDLRPDGPHVSTPTRFLLPRGQSDSIEEIHCKKQRLVSYRSKLLSIERSPVCFYRQFHRQFYFIDQFYRQLQRIIIIITQNAKLQFIGRSALLRSLNLYTWNLFSF